MFFCTTADVCSVADIVGLCLELSLELSSYWTSAFSLPTPWKPFRSDTTLSRERQWIEMGAAACAVSFSVPEDPVGVGEQEPKPICCHCNQDG
jgi:hypothetical protein